MTRPLSYLLPALLAGGLVSACGSSGGSASGPAAGAGPSAASRDVAASDAADAGSAFGPIEAKSHRTLPESDPAPAQAAPTDSAWTFQVRQATRFAKDVEPAAAPSADESPALSGIGLAAEEATGLIALLAGRLAGVSGAAPRNYREEKRTGLERDRDFINLGLPFAQDTPLSLGVQMNGVTLGVTLKN